MPVTGRKIQRINFEFRGLNHQFQEAFSLLPLASPHRRATTIYRGRESDAPSITFIAARRLTPGASAGERGSGVTFSDVDVQRAAEAMREEFGEAAELQAARYADLMLGYSNRAGMLVWARIWRSIVEIYPARTLLPH
jgi:hypothetical protein